MATAALMSAAVLVMSSCVGGSAPETVPGAEGSVRFDQDALLRAAGPNLLALRSGAVEVTPDRRSRAFASFRGRIRNLVDEASLDANGGERLVLERPTQTRPFASPHHFKASTRLGLVPEVFSRYVTRAPSAALLTD